ncbi:hypothetical protein [Butyrivibrio sp. JL13D10]
MKLKQIFTKALYMALSMSFLFLGSTTAFAQCEENEADEGNIIMG